MNTARSAHSIIAKAATDLQQQLEADSGPDAWQLRRIVDSLFDAASALMTAAGDLEAGIVE